LPFTIYGAPLSLFPMLGMFMAPVWWGLVGRMLASQRHQAALIMMIVHAATAAIVLYYCAPGEPREETWRDVRLVQHALPVTLWGGIALYAVGQLVAWWVMIGGAMRRTPTREVT
jgi:hypothetical protein